MQFILHITDHFKISIPRINVAWHPRIRYSRAESDTNNARKAMMLKLVAPSLVACYLNRLQPLENIFADS